MLYIHQWNVINFFNLRKSLGAVFRNKYARGTQLAANRYHFLTKGFHVFYCSTRGKYNRFSMFSDKLISKRIRFQTLGFIKRKTGKFQAIKFLPDGLTKPARQ